MNGITHTKNGGIFKATINANEMKKLNLIWAGVKPSKEEAIRKQSQLVSCFENENWDMVGVSEDFPSSLQTACLYIRISPKDIANFALPEGETKACVVILSALSLTDETERRLCCFGEDMMATMGIEFRVIRWKPEEKYSCDNCGHQFKNEEEWSGNCDEHSCFNCECDCSDCAEE